MMFLSIETRDQTEYATLFFQHSLDTILNALSHICIYIYAAFLRTFITPNLQTSRLSSLKCNAFLV